MNKKFISLLSGGFDSPVAAHLMIKKGFTPIFITFLTFGEKNKEEREKIIKIGKILSEFVGEKIKIYIITHDSTLNFFIGNCSRKLTCVLCKRFMLRFAKHIADLEDTNIIVTGDILGEQASQTLDNLYSYNDLSEYFLFLRPLIGWEKLDVINKNQEIGLYEFCSEQIGSCLYYPRYPETHAKMAEIKQNEYNIDYKNLIEESLQKSEILEI